MNRIITTYLGSLLFMCLITLAVSCKKSNDDKPQPTDPCEGVKTELATAEAKLDSTKIKLNAAITDSTNAAKNLIQLENEAFQNANYIHIFGKACEDSGFSRDPQILLERAIGHKLATKRWLDKFPESLLNETLRALNEACEKYITECTKIALEREAVEQCQKEVERCQKEVKQCENNNT